MQKKHLKRNNHTLSLEDFMEISSSISVDSVSKKVLKEKIISKIELLRSEHLDSVFLEKIESLFANIVPNRIWIARIKEALFENITRPRPWYFVRFSFFSKKAWALIILVAFFFSIYPVSIDKNVTVYAKQTVIYLEKGEADLLREDKVIKVKDGLVIYEGDIINTYNDAEIVVKYPDNNQSELTEDTYLEFNKLSFDSSDLTNSSVVLKLEEGRVLNKIFNSLLSESKFTVNALNVGVVAQNAVFDVAITEEENKSVSVSVINSYVDINFIDDKGHASSKTIFKDDQLNIGASGKYEVKNLNDVIAKDQWLADQVSSQAHEMLSLSDNEAVGESMLQPVTDAIQSILPQQKMDTLKQELDYIQNLFAEAEKYRNKGKLGKAQEFLTEVETRMNNLFVSYDDISEISELQTKMQDLISYYRKYRTKLMPGISYDNYLETFNDLEILVANDELNGKKAKFAQAFENSLASLNQGNIDIQISSINNFVKALNGVIEFSMTLDEKDKNILMTEVNEKTVNLVKTISFVYADTSFEVKKNGLELQKLIQNVFYTYSFKDKSLSQVYGEIQSVIIIVEEDAVNNDLEPVEDLGDTPDVNSIFQAL